MLSDQVLRALMYTRSGEIIEPSGKEGSFSKDNWGDYLVKGAGGAPDKLVRRSTYFKAKILRMPAKQWEAIMEAAQSFVKKKLLKDVRQSPMVLDNSPEEEEEYNEALHDPMFD
jgi:hypothetical protein